MAVNIYGKKMKEDNDKVIYKYGCNYDDLSGELSIDKKELELLKVVESGEQLDEIAFFKIGCKVIKIYNKEGCFPDDVDCIS